MSVNHVQQTQYSYLSLFLTMYWLSFLYVIFKIPIKKKCAYEINPTNISYSSQILLLYDEQYINSAKIINLKKAYAYVTDGSAIIR